MLGKKRSSIKKNHFEDVVSIMSLFTTLGLYDDSYKKEWRWDFKKKG